jgi:hypothetical protein
MIATDLEYRYPLAFHLALVAAAFLTYLFDPVDVVWRFVGGSASPRLLERTAFGVATVVMLAGAALCTRAWTSGAHRARHLGSFLFIIGIATLAPLAGFILLVVGEGLRILRLEARERLEISRGNAPVPARLRLWPDAVIREAMKWLLVLTMVVFVATTSDRAAEYLAAGSVVLGTAIRAWFERSSEKPA